MINKHNCEMIYLSTELVRFLGPQYLDENNAIISLIEVFRYAYGQLPHVKVVEIK